MSNNQQEQSSKSNESSSINESDFAAAIQSHNSSSIEDYNVLKAIGKGKFSVVYRAIEKTSENKSVKQSSMFATTMEPMTMIH